MFRSVPSHRHYIVSMVVYAVVIAGALALSTLGGGTGVGIALAVACAIAFAYTNLAWLRRERAGTGVERTIATESAALAFHALILGLIAYALFEQFAGAPRVSMYVPFLGGTAAWVVAWAAIKRRVT